MDLERLKKAVAVLKNYYTCGKIDCAGVCSDCPYNYSEKELNDSVNVAITVISDVIKSMERLKNEQS